MLSAAALPLAGLYLISAPSSAAAAPRRSLDEAPSWDCNAPPGKNCQSRLGPTDDQSYAEWKADYDEWVAAGRAFFDFAAYSEPGIQWASTSFVQPQAMLHDLYLYDRATGSWTVDRYLDDVEARYGGIDSVLVWQYYPNSGLDDRNNFDMISNLPGGMAGAQEMVAAFQARGVEVLWACFPWDHGTRNTGRPEYVDLVEAVIETGADGINGDTMPGVNVSFWDEGILQGKAMAIEPEIMQSTSGAITGLETNVMSWGQFWNYDKVPLVSAYKSLEPRHLPHLTERWTTNRTDGFHTSFFNGMGFGSWENIWSVYNQITPFHGEMLRRMATILRNTNGITHASFGPHAPVTLQAGVYASNFTNATHTLWTVVNRDSFAKLGAQLAVPCESDDGFFDLYRGAEFVHTCDEGVASLAFELEPAGFGAILKSNDGSPPPAELLAQLAALTETPLADYSDAWAPLQQVLTPTVRTPGQHLPEGMVDIPTINGYLFESSNNCIEGDQLPSAVGLQMPWEDHPRRDHSAVLDIQSFFMDITPATHAQYAAFLAASGYAPTDDQNFLRDWAGGTYPEGWANKPVRWVSRNDAQAYCEHYQKRLPHTWEWQYAADGGQNLTYPWGMEFDATVVPTLVSGRVAPPQDDVDAHPGGASPFGVLDLIGNIYQWSDEACDDHTCRGILRGGNNYRPLGSRWYFPQPGGLNGEVEDQVRGDLQQFNALLLLSEGMDRSSGAGFRCVADDADEHREVQEKARLQQGRLPFQKKNKKKLAAH